MTLIRTTIVTYTINVPDADVRATLIMEAAEKHGLSHEGKLIKGVQGRVVYDGRRGSGKYTVHLYRNFAESNQAQLPPPEKD